jgi:hypothetical protein
MHELAFILQNQLNSDAVQRGAAMVMGVFGLVCLVVVAVIVVPLWFICKKAGFSPWLSLLFFVPFGGVILLYVLAFAEWKVVPLQQLVPLQAAYPQQTPLPPPYPPQQPPLPPQV